MTGDSGPDAVVVLMTAPSFDEARALAHDLVTANLAACVNLVPGATSVYRWEGRVEESSEVLLVAKTTRERYADLAERVAGKHPYDVPEILALPVLEGHRPYLDWLAAAVSRE